VTSHSIHYPVFTILASTGVPASHARYNNAASLEMPIASKAGNKILMCICGKSEQSRWAISYNK